MAFVTYHSGVAGDVQRAVQFVEKLKLGQAPDLYHG